MKKSIILTTETRRHRGKSFHFSSQCLCASVVRGLFPDFFTRSWYLSRPRSISATPAAFRQVSAQCPAPKPYRGAEAAQIGEGRLRPLWRDESTYFRAPAQDDDFISSPNLRQQVAQALPDFTYTDPLGAHHRLHLHHKCTRTHHVHKNTKQSLLSRKADL